MHSLDEYKLKKYALLICCPYSFIHYHVSGFFQYSQQILTVVPYWVFFRKT